MAKGLRKIVLLNLIELTQRFLSLPLSYQLSSRFSDIVLIFLILTAILSHVIQVSTHTNV